MKIMVCGSMSFSKEMMETKGKLEALGHEVFVPVNIDNHLSDPDFSEKLDENHKHCIEEDTIRECFKLIAKSEAIVLLNHKRNGIDGYIGASGLMEIGLAHYLGKKIFLLNKLPDYHKIRWAHEVSIMQPLIINGDLNKIK